MTVKIPAATLLRLAKLAERISMTCVEEPKSHHYQVYMSVRILRQIREVLTDAGIDWRTQRREYVKLVAKLEADEKRKAELAASLPVQQ